MWRNTKTQIPKRWPHTFQEELWNLHSRDQPVMTKDGLLDSMNGLCNEFQNDAFAISKKATPLNGHSMVGSKFKYSECLWRTQLRREPLTIWSICVNINGDTHESPCQTWILNPKVMNHNIGEPNTNSGMVLRNTWIVCFVFLELSFESQCYRFQSAGLWIVNL